MFYFMTKKKKRKIKFNKIQKYLGFPLIFIFFVLLIAGAFLLSNFGKDAQEEVFTCGDGTLYYNCSLRKPYFCLNGGLIEEASICGCPGILMREEDSCVSKYQTNPKNIILKYILRGEIKEINFTVYGEMIDYISSIPKFIYYEKDIEPSRRDFKLRNINEEEQRELLLPLVTKIQNIAENKEDQVRIAISIIQNIPYNESGEIITLGSNQLNYSRYPYEVLYDMKGICGERSELLAFLLREIGYGVVLFYYSSENHECVGIRCPVEYSLDDTGYCFVETTGPSVMTNNQDYYVGGEKLSSKPEVIFISGGDSLGENLYEYKDAKNLMKINKIIEEKGRINLIEHFKLKKLKEKYGLEHI